MIRRTFHLIKCVLMCLYLICPLCLSLSRRTLDELFQSAGTPTELGNMSHGYCARDGVLLRKWIPHEYCVGDPVFQVVVPVKFRHMMIEVAHDKSGHQDVRKTYDRLLRHFFFWPQIKRNISAYIKQCKTCQLTSKPVNLCV